MRTLSAILVLVLSACSGEMSGIVHGGDGGQSGRVQFEYKDNGFGSGDVWARLPDGEYFTGSYVQAQSYVTTQGWATSGSNSTSIFATQSTSSNQYEATLLGNRGNSMRCQFRGDYSRGVGFCEVSDGRQVDLQW